ncbi:hypothetical protein [Radiobacillus sp. PE A8.2]|uniref:hypothetical protein n=1 Tax=Radiobacillus sp. PE A8.2 TaxID=3380349 RepID=UPI00388F80BA
MVTSFNILNILIAIGTMLVPIAIVIFVIIYVSKVVRRTERRAEERLQLDKENAALQQQQMTAISELNQRLQKIENTLKEVE